MWECICDCGNTHRAVISNLRRGHVSSCGCLQREAARGGKVAYSLTNYVVAANDCVIWPGRLTADGYGNHRAVWRKINGPIPDGLQLDHLCRTNACVNPDHLELVTLQENLKRREAAYRVIKENDGANLTGSEWLAYFRGPYRGL